MESEIKFSDIAELRKESVDPKKYSDSKYVGLEHISQGSLQLNGHGFGSDVDSQKQRFYEGDILFGKLRPYFRKVVKAPFDGICSTDIWVVRGKNPADNNFIKFWMASEPFIRSSTGAAEGSRMPRAQWDWVSEFKSPITSPEIRQAIGTFLDRIDQKIQLNQQIASTLEQIAQTIFKSWFVDFDPVHAKARGEQPVGMDAETAALFPDSFEESELGPIPAGWSVEKLGKLLDCLESGKRPKGGASTMVGVPSLGAESIRGLGVFDFHSTKYIPPEFYESMPTGKVQSLDVLIYKDGAGAGNYVAMFGSGFPFAEFAINEHVFLLRSTALTQHFLYFFMSQTSIKRKMVELAQKSAQPGLNQSNVKEIDTLKPTYELLVVFRSLTAEMIEQVFMRSKENVILANIRDSLLPRLISGELEIPAELLGE